MNKRFTDSGLYKIITVLLCVIFASALVYITFMLPPFGSPDNPAVNEVSEKYLTDGLKDTGATNAVAGMILDYRAFDTLGESCVLFVATVAVFILLRSDKVLGSDEFDEVDTHLELKQDFVTTRTFTVFVPIVLMFGLYVIFNGHLSPGGGFSGGAIISGALILNLNAYGRTKTERFMNAKVYTIMSVAALSFYCIAKSYVFYVGANGIESEIPKGIPGHILSSGLILPLNICVGIVVSGTIFAIYTMFRKGGFKKK